VGAVEFQYAFAAYMILGGAAAAWIGPDVGGERPDGSSGPVPPRERIWMRLLGLTCIVFGVALLIATLLGFHGQGAEGPPIP